MILAIVTRVQNVLINPSDPRRVRPELGLDSRGQAILREVQVFQHAAARPVQVRSLVEDDVDHRGFEHALTADGLGVRHAHQRGGQRIGDLILNHLRRLAGEVGDDDHLHVRKIGDRVETDVDRGPDAAGDEHRGQQEHDELVADGKFDDPCDHRPLRSSARINSLLTVASSVRASVTSFAAARRSADCRSGLYSSPDSARADTFSARAASTLN